MPNLDNRPGASKPVFILTLPRSGSTLLRYLLDSHSLITCPPESQIALLCSNVLECWLSYRSPNDLDQRKARGMAQARKAARELMNWHLQQSGKRIFCDKSLPNVDRGQVLGELFGRARFICLYRHPMDFVASAIEASQYGFSGFGLYPYLVGSVDNFVFGLARAWCEKTAAMLAIEERWPKRCHRVLYEELVLTPEPTMRALSKFLEVDFESEAVAGALRATHLEGYGDFKIGLTDRLTSDSVGRGSAVPIRLLTPFALSNLNSLVEQVGYEPISADWNLCPSPLRRGMLEEERASCSRGIEGYLRVSARNLSEKPEGAGAPTIRVLVEEFGDPRGWIVDASAGSVYPDNPEQSVSVTIIARLDALNGLCTGSLSLLQATRDGTLRFGVNAELAETQGARPARLVKLLFGLEDVSETSDSHSTMSGM